MAQARSLAHDPKSGSSSDRALLQALREDHGEI